MRKFVIQTRKDKKTKEDKTVIYEVECEVVTLLQDPSLKWSLKEGEWKAAVVAPKDFYERQSDGTMTPPIWHWFGFIDSLEEAKKSAETNVRFGMVDFAIKKGRSPATEEEVTEAISKIEVVML